jgi:superfamily II DNA or RNA helicase
MINADSNIFSAGARVRDVNNPSRCGTVTNVPPRDRAAGRQWQVLWDNEARVFEYESGLDLVVEDRHGDPHELLLSGQFGHSEDFRRNITFVHLTGRLANLLYSMRVTNTDFYPHQYRPLLAMLESPCDGLLIADEVGLGKTIEAGLIWTELRARYDKRRLLVVCPAALREKWRDELELRFGVRAAIVSTMELLDQLKISADRRRSDEAWIVSYQSARPPRGWTNEDQKNDKSPRAAFAELLDSNTDEKPLFDLVIYDEAHNMRNRETATWRLGQLLRGVAEFQVMLSATPINLRNGDLFSLLSLLDPDHFMSTEDLGRLIESNKPLVRLRDMALNLRSTHKEFLDELALLRFDPYLRDSAQLASLLGNPPTNEDFIKPDTRSALAESLERINLLSHIMVRTRKRDVQPIRIEREVHRQAVVMSESERAFYDYVTETIRRYALARDVNATFLLAMPQRQVASCPAALLRSWRESIPDDDDENYFRTMYDDDDDDGRRGRRPLRDTLIANVPFTITIDDLERDDSKYECLRDLLSEAFAAHPQEKFIIFTTFRTTAKYLIRRLAQDGVPSILVWGNSNVSKYDTITEFRESDRLRVLVSTEVAAEGVDLQFCRAVINYDLPWNPTRVEQRIGRIDRLGQTSPRILVWNLFFADTIDEKIVSRLLARLKTFEEALGEAEAVVGEQIAKLEYELLSRPRTPEEEATLIDRAAVALETVARQRKQIEDNAPHMIAHGASVLQRVNAAQQLARFVSDRDLFQFVHEALRKFWPGHEFVADDTNPMSARLRLSPALSARLDPYLRERGALFETKLANGGVHRVTFRNNLGPKKSKDGEIIHQFHPLVTFLASDLRSRDQDFFPIVALKVRADRRPDGIPPGDYAFALVGLSFAGLNEEEWLMPAVVDISTGALVAENAAELLVTAGRQFGDDWPGARIEADLQASLDAMRIAEDALDTRFEQMRQRKLAENLDRRTFQLESIDRHLARRTLSFIETQQRHVLGGRTSLAKAVEGKRKALEERMAHKRSVIENKSAVTASRKFVCGGVIRVM